MFKSVLLQVLLGSLGYVSLAGSLSAGLNDTERDRLAEQIDLAASHLQADRLPDLARAKADVIRRIEQAQLFFARKTSAENAANWMDYLQLEPLAEAIRDEQPVAQVGREALDLSYRLVGTAPGLELTVLRRLRDSVQHLLAAIRFRDADKSIAALSQQLQSLAGRIRQLDPQPSAEDAAAIAALVDLLSASGQATDVVLALRNTFSHPNAAVLVGAELVQTAIAQNVDETRPVDDCILGTRIIGTARMSGMVTTQLLPSVGAARINVALSGQVISNNTGYNGPVRLRTTGYGNVNAWRAMMINESGIALEPVQLNTSMRTQINRIEHHLRIVRKIARKRAAEQKPQAEAIANRKFRDQVGEQFASQTDEQAQISIPDFMQDVRPVLQRLSLVEPTRLWGSTEQALSIDATVRRHDQLSSLVSRPPVPGSFALAIQIHESAIDNAATPVLAGRTLNEQRLTELLQQIGRELPAGGAGGEATDEAPFEIAFARLRPVIFEARAQTLRLGVRGTRFSQGGRDLNRPMEITAVYRPGRLADGSMTLLREGEVGVDFPGDRRLSLSEAGLKATIQSKFSKVFPEAVLDQPLTVPADAPLEAIRGRQFRPHVVEASGGWLTIAVR